MRITLTELYSLLTEKVGKETAQTLTAYIEQKIDKEINQSTRDLATREDLEKGFKELSRWMLGGFSCLSLMILGLYATIFLK
jgi:hypothetical protein